MINDDTDLDQMDSQNLALVSLSFSHSLRVIRSTFQMGLIAIFFPARNSCQCGVVCCLASDQASGILLLEMTQFMVYRAEDRYTFQLGDFQPPIIPVRKPADITLGTNQTDLPSSIQSSRISIYYLLRVS